MRPSRSISTGISRSHPDRLVAKWSNPFAAACRAKADLKAIETEIGARVDPTSCARRRGLLDALQVWGRCEVIRATHDEPVQIEFSSADPSTGDDLR